MEETTNDKPEMGTLFTNQRDSNLAILILSNKIDALVKTLNSEQIKIYEGYLNSLMDFVHDDILKSIPEKDKESVLEILDAMNVKDKR